MVGVGLECLLKGFGRTVEWRFMFGTLPATALLPS